MFKAILVVVLLAVVVYSIPSPRNIRAVKQNLIQDIEEILETAEQGGYGDGYGGYGGDYGGYGGGYGGYGGGGDYGGDYGGGYGGGGYGGYGGGGDGYGGGGWGD